jgi:hypothetical protein
VRQAALKLHDEIIDVLGRRWCRVVFCVLWDDRLDAYHYTRGRVVGLGPWNNLDRQHQQRADELYNLAKASWGIYALAQIRISRTVLRNLGVFAKANFAKFRSKSGGSRKKKYQNLGVRP